MGHIRQAIHIWQSVETRLNFKLQNEKEQTCHSGEL